MSNFHDKNQIKRNHLGQHQCLHVHTGIAKKKSDTIVVENDGMSLFSGNFLPVFSVCYVYRPTFFFIMQFGLFVILSRKTCTKRVAPLQILDIWWPFNRFSVEKPRDLYLLKLLSPLQFVYFHRNETTMGQGIVKLVNNIIASEEFIE